MPTKIFLTGITGYIGGDAFYAVEQKHPDYEFTVLVRNEERAKPVKAKYPNIKVVYGSLDDVDVIEKAASEADIVIHTADSADNEPSAKAIAKGLAAGHTAEKPGYWIHVSGTGILTWKDQQEKRIGQAPDPNEKYDDVNGIDRVIDLPDVAHHRNIDKLVLAANDNPAVKTAIVGPPTIVGPGRGPGNTNSIQVPQLVTFALKNGFVPVLGTGLTEWDNVNVHDLSDLFVKLVDAAQDPQLAGNPEVFGGHAYYFAEAGTHLWGDVARLVADELVKQRFMAEPKVETATIDQVVAHSPVGATWGLNSKGVANRARKYLGWNPTGPGLSEVIPEAVSSQAKKLGIEPHAAS